MKNFVHLHVHTEYSLLDGAARISDLLDKTKNLGMDSIAITDHGVMYGVVDFYKQATLRGIKPIIGCEVYFAPKTIYDREMVDGVKYYHLVLLAENNEGYKNLVKLISVAATQGMYYKPRIDKDYLEKYHDGLIALSACLQGEIPKTILNKGMDSARKCVEKYIKIFGRDNFFLEIQNHGIDAEKTVRNALIQLSREYNVGLVATNDSHYVNREDSEVQDLLLCLQTDKKIDDKNRMRFSSDDYYLKSPEEMRNIFFDVPEACDNTIKIAERCNVSFEFGKLQMPVYPIPAQYNTAKDYLRKLCNDKLSERYEVVNDKIISRLDYELNMINKMGYDGYFLIVWDFINYAKRNGIAVGPGRGSAAGSIVAYLLGITELDPLKYNLLFERFLNPDRVTMPDIDIDFCYKRRGEVIKYVQDFYGYDNVAQIITFGTLAAKAVLRDIFRVMNLSYSESDRVVKMIPNELNITLDKALQTSKELKAEYEGNPQIKKIIDFAKKLEGLPRHYSVHAAGIVISKIPLEDYVPVQISGDEISSQDDTETKELGAILIAQFDKDKIEELGLLKMDFLGLRTLTVIDEAVTAIAKNHGVKIDINKIPLDDKVTARMLSTGKTGAVFQMESIGMTKLVRDLKPECFEDLIPTVALYRPGPLGSGMVEDFINGKHGKKSITYLHPKLEPILKETFGVILYQEQVMQIVQVLAGFSLGQADLLRRAMSKKKADILMAQKENFLKGCAANGVDKSLAEKIFELLLNFADYGFNKSHSAAYALLAWQTAYLKAHYPAEFMAAMLSSVINTDRIGIYVELARNMGLKILPPDINHSDANFKVEGGAIRFALAAIKNINEAKIREAVSYREVDGKFKPFRSLVDFCRRVNFNDFNRKSLENLIKCGAFDGTNSNRAEVLESLELAIKEGEKNYSDNVKGQGGLFGDEEILQVATPAPKVENNFIGNILAGEKEALGFYLSGNPLDDVAEKFAGLTKFEKILGGNIALGKRVKVGGIIVDLRVVTTKKGDMMAFTTLENFGERLDVTIFPNIYEHCANVIAVDEIIVVDGRLDDESILADSVVLAAEYTPEIYLTIPAQSDTADIRRRLHEIFNEHRGNSTVYLKRAGKWRRLDKNFNLADSVNLRTKLKNLLGDRNVKIC